MARIPKYGLLAAVPLALAAAVAFADDMEVEATIQAVSETDRSLTVEFNETGATQTFHIGEDTEISFENDGRATLPVRNGIEDLRTGQQVTLRFDDEMMEDDWVVLHFITIS